MPVRALLIVIVIYSRCFQMGGGPSGVKREEFGSV